MSLEIAIPISVGIVTIAMTFLKIYTLNRQVVVSNDDMELSKKLVKDIKKLNSEDYTELKSKFNSLASNYVTINSKIEMISQQIDELSLLIQEHIKAG